MADKKKKAVLYIRNISQDTKDRFKAVCSLRGKSMNAVINKLIKEYVKENHG